MPVDIRAAEPGDAETIFELVQALAEYEREPRAVEATAEDYRAALVARPPAFEALIAEDGGDAVGFALFFFTYSTWRGRRGLWLEDLFVVPDARGRGVGGRLLRRLAALARERGCARFEWIVLDWNEPAIEFYEHLGARPLDGWTTWRIDGAALRRLAEEDA